MSQPDHPAAAEELPPLTAESFPAKPDLECDIIMKGGITSGVIYPLAACELAKTYRLHSVGGASAGAIAAAVAAAAEVGRASLADGGAQAGPQDAATLPPGYLGLSRFPDLLSEKQPDGNSLLFHLFRPQPEAKRLFELATAGMDGVTQLPRPVKPWAVLKLAARLVIRAGRWALRRALLGLLPGLAVLALGIIGLIMNLGVYGALLSILMIMLGIIIAVLGWIVAVLVAVVDDIKKLPAIGFGISSGRGESESDLALTPWLYRRLQELASKPLDQPLTIGDLKQHGVDFQAMTTNLSRAEPLVMPWNNDIYFFKPDEFRKLFGDDVVKEMEGNPPPLPSAPAERRDREVLLQHVLPRRPFPRPEKLPVIVATRMSLSFPLLISAVPLYAIDYDFKTNQGYSESVSRWRRDHPGGTLEQHVQEVKERPTFDVNWFSDGGLTANLPVQFFDAPLPSRPTFAIDLAGFTNEHPRSPDERLNSYLPVVNQGGLHRRTARWKPEPLSQLVSFGKSLVQTARTWVDEASLVLPGYRDRVVTVYQDGGEGGLNLSMPDEVVARLSRRGRFAAQKLVDRFGPAGGGWTNHRWIRFRTATSALSDWFAGFEKGYTAPAAESYDELLNGQADEPSYPMTDRRRAAARVRITDLRGQINTWATDPADAFTNNRPRKPPVLRLGPPADADPASH
jgi:hypothetical protein